MRRLCAALVLVPLLLLVVAIALGWGTRTGRAAVKTFLFIPAVVPAVEMRLQERLTAPPLHERVSIPTPAGLREGDLYRPRGPGPYPAALLFLGVAPAGADDSRVVNLGQALARSGMVVLWYWSPAFAEKRIEEQEVANIVAAFQYLQGRSEVDRTRVGLGGFCIGASFVLLAAAEEPIREEVAFVNAFGPYLDARDLTRAIASRTRFEGGRSSSWEPDPLTREVFTYHLLEAVPDPAEAAALRRAILEGGAEPDLARLSPEARAVYGLLRGVPLGEVEPLLAALPASFRERLVRISPAAHVERVTAPVLIMHDAEDHLIPAAESRRLAAVRQSLGLPTLYTEFTLFQHVTPEKRLGRLALARELGKLFRHLHALMLQTT